MKRKLWLRYAPLLVALAAAFLVTHCGDTHETVTVIPSGGGGGTTTSANVCTQKNGAINRMAAMQKDCPALSDYRLYQNLQDPTANPNGDGLPYSVTTLLFTNYARKARIIYLPKDESGKPEPAQYRQNKTFTFPVGTIISKTFYFPHDARTPQKGPKHLIETRLLIHRKDGWVGLPYVWKPNGSGATLMPNGAHVEGSVIGLQGKTWKIPYNVPSAATCQRCHQGPKGDSPNYPIGLKVRYLNYDYTYPDGKTENQLAHMTRLGLLKGAPSDPAKNAPSAPMANNPKDGSITQRARAYLDANCGYCHRQHATAGEQTGMYLLDNFRTQHPPGNHYYGICKLPESAGAGAGNRRYDIVPGKPQQSILMYRIKTSHYNPKTQETNPQSIQISMPPYARSVPDFKGDALVNAWIKQLKGSCG